MFKDLILSLAQRLCTQNVHSASKSDISQMVDILC